MFDVWQANYAIELWGVAFCVVGIVCTLLLVPTDKSFRNLIILMFSLELLAASGDVMTIAFGFHNGHTDELSRLLCYVGNLAFFVGTFLLQAAVSLYLCLRFREVGGGTYRPWRICVCLWADIMCLLAALGVLYGFDESNVYYRKDGYWLSIVFVVCSSMVNTALVIANRRRLERATLVCLLVYTLAPLVASIVQSFVYGPNLATATGVMGLVVVFIELQTHSARTLVERTEELARAQDQAARERTAVMVAQMQPHFLFNTLDTIYELAEVDPQAAREAIATFSRYLRTNLASLNRVEPVPVAMELEHVRTYLELERTSDPERIAYELDVKSTGFGVPALSVQTLAENAVKHGLGKRPEGGTVRVSTREHATEYTVAIADDGVGFDTGALPAAKDRAAVPNGAPGGVGIENTRSRLACMCGGTLEVSSEPGVGTTVVMHVPKRGAEGSVVQ